MIKQFIKDTGIYGLSGLISKGVSIFLLPFYTHVLSPGDYGIVDILAIFFSLVSVTVPLEITQAVARFLADRKGDNLSKDSNTILVSSIGLYFTFFAFGSFLIIGLIFRNFLTHSLLDDYTNSSIFIVALFYMFFTGMFYFFQNQLRWTLKSKIFAFLSLFYTIISISFTITFVLFLKTGVIGIFYAQLISGFVCAILGWYFSRENYALTFSFSKTREMLKFSLPLVPSSVGVIFINSSQRVMIKGLMGLSDLGLYGVGSRLSSFINLGFQSVQGAITPLIYQNIDNQDTPEKLATIFRFLSYFLLSAFVIISLFAYEIVYILTAPAYYAAFKIVPFLILAECFSGMQQSFTPGMAIARRTDVIAYINILGAAFALGLSVLFIYYFGILGAAIAVLLQRIIMFIVQMNYSQKFYPIPVPFKKTAIALITAILIISIGLFITIYVTSLLRIAIKIALIIVFLFVVVNYIKLIKIGEVKEIFNKLKLILRKR